MGLGGLDLHPHIKQMNERTKNIFILKTPCEFLKQPKNPTNVNRMKQYLVETTYLLTNS